MPFRNRVKRWKNKLLGSSSENASTSSLPNLGQTSPSPQPPPLSRAETPPTQAPIYSTHTKLPTDQLSPAAATNPAHPIAASTESSSNVIITQPPVSAAPSLRKTDVPSGQELDLERAKSTAWAGLKTLLKVLESSADAFGPLKSAIGGLNQCIDIYEKVAKGREDFNELRTKLDSLLEDLGQFWSSPIPPTMTTSMKNLCSGIEKELDLVKDRQNRGTARRYAEAMGDAELVLECYRRIEGHLERLALNSNLNMWKLVDEQATEARLNKLSPTLSAAYNSAEGADVKRGPCTAGTREQELATLRQWVCNKLSGEVYWMNGMAGTGKTTIAYSLCLELDEAATLGASFFCSRLIPECRNVKLILPAIAYQLARFSYPFQCALSRILRADPDVHTRLMKTQFEKLLVAPLLEAKDTLPSDLIVVIDALDECENKDSVEQILDVILKNTAVDLPIRFIMSSRPEPEIYPRMMSRVGDGFNARLVLHDLDAVRVQQDIRTYLIDELMDVHLTTSQLAALVERSGVLFIYASTAARYIKAGLRFKEHEERLNMILGLAPPSADGNDKDIDVLYTSILSTALQDKDLNEFSRARMKTILDTVICAQEPMSISGLAGLLRLKSGELVDALLRPFGSVLNIAETGGLVTTLHASFPDFMLDEQRSSSFHCNPTTNHGRLAQACFELITANKPQYNICGLLSSYHRDEKVADMAQRVDRAVSPDLFYACRFWISHLELADRLANAAELLYDFLSVRLLLWMEVLNVKASINLGPGIVQRAENWSRRHNCSNETTELAHDAWCFATMFTSHSASQSTPHLYISMLPFWPESSPIARHYAKRMRGAIKAQGTAISRRQLSLLATWPFDGDMRSARFSPDGSLITFGVSASVLVVDAITGRTVVGPLEHESTVYSVAFSPDGTLIASGSEDKTIRVWSVQNGQLIVGPLTGHTEEVTSVAFSPDGTRIVSASGDYMLRVWDVLSGQMVGSPLQGHTKYIYSVCFSPDGMCIASGSMDKTIRGWDAQNGQLIFCPREHTGQVTSVCFSPDGICVASGSMDKTIRVWSAQDGRRIAGPLEGHSSYVMSVVFSPDGQHIVSGSDDHTIRLWDLNSDPISAKILGGHTAPVTSVAFSSDGSRIVSCSDDNTIRVWDARSRATVADSLEGHTGTVLSIGYSPDGKHIVSGSGDTTIRMWDAESGQMVGGPLQGHTDWVRSVCFSPDGMRIVSGSYDRTIRAWDVQSGQTVVGPLEGHTELVLSICLSPDGALIASGSCDKTIRVWDAQDGTPVGNSLEGHNALVRSICFSPDSVHIASGSDDRTIRVWDAKSGQNVAGPLEGHTNLILSVCFSPDGTCLASGSEGKAVRVWDAQRGQAILGPLEGHTGGINSVCFSHNGTLIVSGSEDETVRLWDVRSGQAVGDPLVGHTGPVWSVAFSPDGKHIVSGSDDQTIRVWDVHGILRMYGVADFLPSPGPGPISPPRPHESWILREDGWVVDRDSRLLVWMPPDLHAPLLRPHNTLAILPKGCFKLDFDSAKLGESWAECYQPSSS